MLPPSSQGSSQQEKPPAAGFVKVMLVDDSAVIRGLFTRALESEPGIKVVNSVGNGEFAVQTIRRTDPDIVLLDVEMPVMDGITALPKLLEQKPGVKVVMCSTLTEKGAAISMKAMELGAVDCLCKPSSTKDATSGTEFQRQLVSLVKSLGGPRAAEVAAPPGAQRSARDILSGVLPKQAAAVTLRNDPAAWAGKPSIVAIGSSTGGPQALFTVSKSLKGFDVPIVITQHMPPKFTKILAEHIQQQTGIPAHEGEEGMALENGHIYVAPGGFHMELESRGGKTFIHLSDGPPENFCKPAVDPMMRSVIKLYGRKVLGVILTGMGQDGLNGGKMLVEGGGRLIAQDEKTSVVWGMPGAVATAGLCSAVLPLNDIGPWVRKAVLGY